MPILIEKDGEVCFVASLAGYDGWTVIGEGEEFRPLPHATFDPEQRRLIVDEEAKAAAARADRRFVKPDLEEIDRMLAAQEQRHRAEIAKVRDEVAAQGRR